MSRLFWGCANRALTGALLGAVVSVAGCGGSDSHAPPVAPQVMCAGPANGAGCPAIPGQSVGTLASQDSQNNTPVGAALVTANNNFGLSVLSTLLSQGASGNPAVGSMILAETLEATYNGAAGTTQQSLYQVLQLAGLGVLQSSTTVLVNSDNAALQGALLDPDPDVTLLTNSSLWANSSSNPPGEAFNQANSTYYGANLVTITGTVTSAMGTNAVDDLASFYTYKQVTDVLGGLNYDDPNNSVLPVSTVYFKGSWQFPFNPILTHTDTFTISDGSQTSDTAMVVFLETPYLQGSNFQAISLPYGKDARLSMLVVMPASGTNLNTFVAGVSDTTVGQWESQMQTVDVKLTLPRFTSSFTGSLRSALTTLGMGVAFDPNNANFSGIFTGAYLDDVIHGVVVSVNENGTTVAAPGSIGGITTEPVASNMMTVDQPFFYAIRDNLTGELLVIGAVTDPGSG